MNSKNTSKVPPIQSFPPIQAEALPFIDEVDASTKYVGYAPRGIGEKQAGWLLLKYETVGTVTKILFAEGSDRWDKVWDNRALYNYSR